MVDRTIPFYNTILRCDEYHPQSIKLPDGYTIAPYKNGFEKDWARLEYAVGDFPSVEEAWERTVRKVLHGRIGTGEI